MRVVLDTNVVVSGILFRGNARALFGAVVGGDIVAVTSETLLDELEDILARKFGFSRVAAREARAEVAGLAVLVEPNVIRRVCRDPDDDHVLAAALDGSVALIVTGDKDLLNIGSYEGIEIVTPAEAVERLGFAT